MSQRNDNILADSIAGIPHLAAFDAMANSRMNALEIESLLIYVIDTVDVSALPLLANQFDVEGFQGYGLATTEAQKRNVIKQAIELKRYMGTVYAIKQAMLNVGYSSSELVEGIDLGDPLTDWARFSVHSELGDTSGIEGTSQSYLAKLIRSYKNVRSILEGISYSLGIFDTLETLNDTLNLTYQAPDLEEDLGYFARFANGVYLADGSIKAIESLDSLVINIQNV